ncbi:MAG: sigma-70 family RNA polymerase sigma factor [Gemmatimonadaceae bacterium]|nr:sigma-70 family RNA polymerase sigma factor [Gemmatimonadaceae bacterium]
MRLAGLPRRRDRPENPATGISWPATCIAQRTTSPHGSVILPSTDLPAPVQDITALVLSTDPSAPVVERLVPLVYDQLREIARRHLRNEQAGHTLSTTALVHEAYLRLVNVPELPEENRARFLAAASVAMRRVLLDYARARKADKRGGLRRRVTLDDALGLPAGDAADDLLPLDDALTRLSAIDPRLVQVVECRFFGGMTDLETAMALGTSERTVRRDWLRARGWLAAELGA